MSDNPYQTPGSMPLRAEDQEEVGDFDLMRNTSFWAILSLFFLGTQIVLYSLHMLSLYRPSEELVLMLQVGAIISVCVWTYKSMSNAWVAGKIVPTITSGGAVISYFVPILWFWRPYLAIRQIWGNLFGKESSKFLVTAWWLMWLGIWAFIVIKMLHQNTPRDKDPIYYYIGKFGVVFCTLAAGVFLMMIISKITMGQNRRIAKARR